MRTLYVVGGTMGVGKTTVCKIMADDLPNSVFLDGDWCWDLHPFRVTDETKRMVMGNIVTCLTNFLACPAIDNVVFCWVMHERSIIDGILSPLDLEDVRVVTVSLTCDEQTLRDRLAHDVDAGLREPDVIERSVTRLPLYAALETEKVDTTSLSPDEVARRIEALR
jgi:broad-specificity NMP kinase